MTNHSRHQTVAQQKNQHEMLHGGAIVAARRILQQLQCSTSNQCSGAAASATLEQTTECYNEAANI
jgi:hypothetical protein